MKKALYLCSLFVYLFLGVPLLWAAHGSVIPLESVISKVIVYRDQAEVIRTAKVHLKAGQSTLMLRDLPAMLQDDSVQVDVKGQAGILDIEVKRAFPIESASEKIRKLEAEIRALEKQDRAFSDEEGVLKSQQAFLESIKAATASKISQEFLAKIPNPQDIKGIMVFVYKEKQNTARKLQEAGIRRQEIKKKIDALRKELRQISSLQSRVTKTIAVTLEADRDVEATLFLHYLIMRASWRPRYQARVLSTHDEVELTLIGDVRQKTGEDWKQASLVLSTAMPSRGAQAPELRPWYLNLRPPARPAMRFRKEAVMSSAVVDEDAVMAAGEAAPTRVEVGETAVNFEVKGQVSIPSDWSFHKTILARDRFKGKLAYITVPKLNPEVYLRASLTNETIYPLLAGHVDIFLGTQYIGKSRIKTIVPEESFNLDLGIDENIKVKRELIKKKEEETGVFSKERRLHYLYKITLESFKTKPGKVALMDQIPVSQNEQIKVITDILDPEPTEKSDNGIFTWEFEIGPREKREFTLGYTIQFPKDRDVMD